MRIRTKILGIPFLFVLATLVSLFVYSYFSRRAVQIQNEQDTLQEIQDVLWQERRLTSGFMFQNLQFQIRDYNRFQEERTTVTDLVDSLEYLPEISKKAEEALQIMMSLDGMTASRRKGFVESRDSFVQEVEIILGSSNLAYNKVLENDRLYRSERYDQFVDIRNSFISSSQSMLNTLDTSIELVETQTKNIQTEIARLKKFGLIVSFAIIIPLILLVLFLSFRIVASILGSIRDMQQRISSFMEGDLTQAIESTSKDEMGELGGDLDNFRTSLMESMHRIQGISSKNMESKSGLMESVSDTHMSMDEVLNNVGAIDLNTDSLKKFTDQVALAMDSTRKLMESQNKQIANQYAMVENSSSAVEEMTSSVDSIARMAQTSRERIGQLVHISKDGGYKLQETRELIQRINGSIETILSMVEMLENISSQTDLLSMNAAIEAAHAGEAGKGFSVVAQEIGKLAEVAAQNTREMSSEITRIIDSIRSADESSAETSSSFQSINGEIEQVDRIISEVYGAVEELKTGGIQIQQAMVQLRDFSAGVEQTSNEISSNTQRVMDEISRVSQSAVEVKQASSYISGNMETIRNGMGRVEGASNQMERDCEILEDILARFRTEK